MENQEVAPIKKSTVIFAFSFAVLLLLIWEIYCRANDYQVAPNDDKHLWASQRAKLNNLEKEDVVIIGSSRAMFDLQLEEWEANYGKKPIMLAAAGSSVMPVLRDLVENSTFSGKLIIGVTPPLYFAPQRMEVIPFARIQKWVDHYHKRTYADQFNHNVSKYGPQKLFAFLTTSNEIFYNELDLRTLIERLPVEHRFPGPPPFPILYQVDDSRNVSLMPQVTKDTAYAAEVTRFWSVVFSPPPGKAPPLEVIDQNRKDIISQTTELLNKFRERGGEIVLVRCPSQNLVRDIEAKFYPRTMYWDELVKSVNAPAYHFEDYAFMNQYELPEWSHLSSSDSKKFTIDFVNQLKEDKVLMNLK